MKKLFIAFLWIALLLGLSACMKKDADDRDGRMARITTAASTTLASTESENTEETELSFGSTFTFDDLEFTIGNAEDIAWTTVDNELSDHNGEEVIVLPVTVKNLKEEDHSLSAFHYTFYGPAGRQLDMVYSYFADDIFAADSIQSGASVDGAFHILYIGDGNYRIQCNDISSKEKVWLSITK